MEVLVEILFLNTNLSHFLLVEEVEVPEPKAPGVYRPPGARLTSTKKVSNQGPPEIYNDTQFPSLLSTARHVETRKWVTELF